MQLTGTMARRLLVNWRIPIATACRVLPAGLRPKIVAGHAVAGLCLVRLEAMRPVGLRACTGLTSENLAVRMGVEWDGGGGVLIFSRETASRLNAFIGARSRFGEHHRGTFRIHDDGHALDINIHGIPGGHVHHASVVEAPPTTPSVFENLPAAERFFRSGECGYSPSRRPGLWKGLRLHLHHRDLRSLRVLSARSTLIDALFNGQAVLDSAFILRHVQHTWTTIPAKPWGPLPVATSLQALAA